MQPQNPLQPIVEQPSHPDPPTSGQSNISQPSSLVNSGKVIQPTSDNLSPPKPINHAISGQYPPIPHVSSPLPLGTMPEVTADQNPPAAQPTDDLVGLTGSQIPE